MSLDEFGVAQHTQVVCRPCDSFIEVNFIDGSYVGSVLGFFWRKFGLNFFPQQPEDPAVWSRPCGHLRAVRGGL